MTLRRGLVLIGLLVGCGQDGAQGAAGTTGAVGPAGPMGAMGGMGGMGGNGSNGEGGAAGDGGHPTPSGGVRWVDRSGAVVGVIAHVTDGTGSRGQYAMTVVDASGYVWLTDAWGRFDVNIDMTAPFLFYTTTDCTGTAYLDFEMPPRYVFKVDTDGGGYRAMPDNVASAGGTTYNSTRDASNVCSVSTGILRASSVPYATTLPAVAIVKPTSLFVAPVHPEYVP